MSDIQSIIVREMKVKPQIDSQEETESILQFIKTTFNLTNLFKVSF